MTKMAVSSESFSSIQLKLAEELRTNNELNNSADAALNEFYALETITDILNSSKDLTSCQLAGKAIFGIRRSLGISESLRFSKESLSYGSRALALEAAKNTKDRIASAHDNYITGFSERSKSATDKLSAMAKSIIETNKNLPRVNREKAKIKPEEKKAFPGARKEIRVRYWNGKNSVSDNLVDWYDLDELLRKYSTELFKQAMMLPSLFHGDKTNRDVVASFLVHLEQKLSPELSNLINFRGSFKCVFEKSAKFTILQSLSKVDYPDYGLFPIPGSYTEIFKAIKQAEDALDEYSNKELPKYEAFADGIREAFTKSEEDFERHELGDCTALTFAARVRFQEAVRMQSERINLANKMMAALNDYQQGLKTELNSY